MAISAKWQFVKNYVIVNSRVIITKGLVIWLILLCLVTLYFEYQNPSALKSLASWLTEHKDLFPLIGPAFLIVSFTIDRYIAYKLRKKETYRSWYLKTLIDPHLKEVETFFSELPDLYKDSCKSLKKSKKSLTEDSYLSLQTKYNETFQKKKEKIDYEFVTIVAYNNEVIAEDLTSILNQVEDIFTTSLDKLEDNYYSVNGRFAICKAQVYSLLARPLE